MNLATSSGPGVDVYSAESRAAGAPQCGCTLDHCSHGQQPDKWALCSAPARTKPAQGQQPGMPTPKQARLRSFDDDRGQRLVLLVCQQLV